LSRYTGQAFWPVFFNLNFKEKTTMKSGIIYKGPSLLDGKPIVVIATFSKRNTKTGEVVQTYILVDGMNPLDASKTGADFSICGDCAMRGEVTTDPTASKPKIGAAMLTSAKAF
jgi:hypothetical protein